MRREVAALEEERDLLLRSLDDLDAEHAAGDIDDADYEALRDSYTARAATVLHRLEEQAGEERRGAEAGSGVRDRRSRAVRITVGAGLIAFAVLAGVVLANTMGERGVDDQLTGGIDRSARTMVVRCQELGSTGGDLIGSLECFDEILAVDPENAEALTYRGWYVLLAGGSLQSGSRSPADDEAARELIDAGLAYLDRAIAADPALPDPYAFRATAYDRLGESELVCADLAELRSLDPPQFFLDQTASLADRNGC